MFKLFIAPVVGGIIGYITNDLAIRMLFRPRKAIYIGKFHIPFTPGLIPSQKGRIAQSIGSVISKQLLNEETLRETMLSENAIAKLQSKVKEMMRELKEEQRTLNELLDSSSNATKYHSDLDKLEDKLANIICEKIAKARIGHDITDRIAGQLSNAIGQNRVLGMLVDDNISVRLKEMIAEKINEIIDKNAHGAIDGIVKKTAANSMNSRVCDIYDKYKDHEDEFIQRVTDIYVSVLGGNLGKLLQAINIEQIVVDKINAFDAAQLETMIFGIMKRELNAIVYLGAILGFLMGFINILF